MQTNYYHPVRTNHLKANIGVFLVTISLIFVTFIFDNNTIKGTMWVLFLLQMACILLVITKKSGCKFLLLSPSFICISYISINIILGSLVYYYGYVANAYNYNYYAGWRFTKTCTIYFLICNLAAYQATIFNFSNLKKLPEHIKLLSKNRNPYIVILICIIIMLSFIFVDADLSVIGGNGSASFILQSVCAICIFYCAFRYIPRFRWLIYLSLILLMSALNFHNKRQGIFLIIPVFFIEVIFAKRIKIKLKHIVLATLVLALGSILISAMSITRGYGNYDTKSVAESIKYVPDYLLRSDAITNLSSNFEVGYSFFHSFQSLEYILEGKQEIAYGSTIYKLIFVPFPKAIIGEKPTSTIDQYTMRHDPAFRRIGGSYPIVFYSEMFWNFHLLGVLFVFAILLIFNYVYYNFLVRISSEGIDFLCFGMLMAYQFLLVYFRGSGIDIFGLYVGLALLFAYVMRFLLRGVSINNI